MLLSLLVVCADLRHTVPQPASRTGTEVIAFEKASDECHVDQNVADSVLDLEMQSLRVLRVDGGMFSYDVSGTLR